MRNGILGSLAALAVGAGLSYGQGPIGPGGPPPMGPGGPGLVSPDGHPIIGPPGLEGSVPHWSMGNGAGGAYGPGGPGGEGGYGSGAGIFSGAGPGASRFWGGFDYLLWQPKSFLSDYPFISTSAPADLGIAGGATTSLLCTEKNITFGTASGFRAWFGMAFDDSGSTGVEFGGFLLESRAKSSEFRSNGVGFPLIAVPFFDVASGQQASYIVAFPGISAGGARVEARTQAWGAEINGVMSPMGSDGGFTVFCGGRYFELEERFALTTQSTSFGIPPVGPGGVIFAGGGGAFGGVNFGAFAPFTISTSDRVRTFNEFYGANVGIRGEANYGRVFLQVTGKVAAGYMRQRVEIDASSTLTSPNVVANQPGALLNTASDICTVRKDRFAYLPEGALNLGYSVSERLRLTVGYTFLYVNNVLRPYSVTTQNLNTNFIPVSPNFTGARPINNPADRDVLSSTDFWLQGVNFGLQFSF